MDADASLLASCDIRWLDLVFTFSSFYTHRLLKLDLLE